MKYSDVLGCRFLFLFCGLYLCFSFALKAQEPARYTSAQIEHLLDKVQVLGNVLYLAAHPDDENTRLISWLANEKHYRTGYLSLTRGDGGQNLIGPEIRERLGIIRTQELLAARRIDGGEQFFTRANDFGYSKHTDETFRIWNHDSILSDVVYVIRKFKPDVIITRFNDTPGTTHGHHTASAILAKEAFEAAADPRRFPEQLDRVSVWQPKRLYWNTSSWFFRDGVGFDSTQYLSVDVGTYNPLLGKSYTEIAAESRSMHRSQGFGVERSRGSSLEFLEAWEGDNNPKTIFDGIVTDWSRVDGGEAVGRLLRQAARDYNSREPQKLVPTLLTAYAQVQAMPDNPYKNQKSDEIRSLILAASGLFLDLSTNVPQVAQGEPLELHTELVNRSKLPIQLQSLQIAGFGDKILEEVDLTFNKPVHASYTFQPTDQLPITQPYWLREKASLGHFHFPDSLVGKAENAPVLQARARLQINGSTVDYYLPLRYKKVSPDLGELYQPLAVTPRVMVNMPTDMLLFTTDEPKSLVVKVQAGADSVAGRLRLHVEGTGWNVLPESQAFSISRSGDTQSFRFKIEPPKGTQSTKAVAFARIDGQEFSRGMETLSYPHLPAQTFFPKAELRVVRVDVKSRAKKVVYVPGAGDAIPEALRLAGYQLSEVPAESLTRASLKGAAALVLGVRAYNTQPALAYKYHILEEFAREGGVVIIQYNTSFNLVSEHLAPYPLKLSQERVTEEDAPVRLLEPNHPALSQPNQITAADFEGWVQERGLYFPTEWDVRWTPLLSSNDRGEPERKGGLLVAPYGKGWYVYTGYSWFRELPAGVPGAYRLFANLLSLGASAN